MKKLVLIFVICLCYLTNIAQKTGSFTDLRDGKVYKTVNIGTQTWFAENLAYKYKVNIYSYAYEKSDSNVAKYGYLYNFEGAKLVCPDGWRLPKDTDWTILVHKLGGDSLAGGKLKEKGTAHWFRPNMGATDSIGFKALPAGNCDDDGHSYNLSFTGFWWTFTEFNTQSAWYRSMTYENSKVSKGNLGKMTGLSVRCIKY